MRTQFTGKFLATVAASATTVGTGSALAADVALDPVVIDPVVVDSRIAIAFEGGVLQSDVGDKLGAGDKLGDHDADIYGAISLTRQISPDIDWRLSGAYHFGSEREFDLNADTPGGEFDFRMGDEFDFQTVDFDIGKRINVGAADVRLFGGLRALHVSEDFDFGFDATPDDPNDTTTNVDKVGSSEFYGIGPRIGASGYYALGQNWGLSGSLAGAAIWGRRDTDLGFDVFSDDPDDTDDPTDIDVDIDRDSTEVIANVELTAGVTFMPWESTSFTAGYRVDHWDSLLSGGFSGEEDEDQTFHGPFLRLEVKM